MVDTSDEEGFSHSVTPLYEDIQNNGTTRWINQASEAVHLELYSVGEDSSFAFAYKSRNSSMGWTLHIANFTMSFTVCGTACWNYYYSLTDGFGLGGRRLSEATAQKEEPPAPRSPPPQSPPPPIAACIDENGNSLVVSHDRVVDLVTSFCDNNPLDTQSGHAMPFDECVIEMNTYCGDDFTAYDFLTLELYCTRTTLEGGLGGRYELRGACAPPPPLPPSSPPPFVYERCAFEFNMYLAKGDVRCDGASIELLAHEAVVPRNDMSLHYQLTHSATMFSLSILRYEGDSDFAYSHEACPNGTFTKHDNLSSHQECRDACTGDCVAYLIRPAGSAVHNSHRSFAPPLSDCVTYSDIHGFEDCPQSYVFLRRTHELLSAYRNETRPPAEGTLQIFGEIPKETSNDAAPAVSSGRRLSASPCVGGYEEINCVQNNPLLPFLQEDVNSSEACHQLCIRNDCTVYQVVQYNGTVCELFDEHDALDLGGERCDHVFACMSLRQTVFDVARYDELIPTTYDVEGTCMIMRFGTKVFISHVKLEFNDVIDATFYSIQSFHYRKTEADDWQRCKNANDRIQISRCQGTSQCMYRCPTAKNPADLSRERVTSIKVCTDVAINVNITQHASKAYGDNNVVLGTNTPGTFTYTLNIPKNHIPLLRVHGRITVPYLSLSSASSCQRNDSFSRVNYMCISDGRNVTFAEDFSSDFLNMVEANTLLRCPGHLTECLEASSDNQFVVTNESRYYRTMAFEEDFTEDIEFVVNGESVYKSNIYEMVFLKNGNALLDFTFTYDCPFACKTTFNISADHSANISFDVMTFTHVPVHYSAYGNFETSNNVVQRKTFYDANQDCELFTPRTVETSALMSLAMLEKAREESVSEIWVNVELGENGWQFGAPARTYRAPYLFSSLTKSTLHSRHRVQWDYAQSNNNKACVVFDIFTRRLRTVHCNSQRPYVCVASNIIMETYCTDLDDECDVTRAINQATFHAFEPNLGGLKVPMQTSLQNDLTFVTYEDTHLDISASCMRMTFFLALPRVTSSLHIRHTASRCYIAFADFSENSFNIDYMKVSQPLFQNGDYVDVGPTVSSITQDYYDSFQAQVQATGAGSGEPGFWCGFNSGDQTLLSPNTFCRCHIWGGYIIRDESTPTQATCGFGRVECQGNAMTIQNTDGSAAYGIIECQRSMMGTCSHSPGQQKTLYPNTLCMCEQGADATDSRATCGGVGSNIVCNGGTMTIENTTHSVHGTDRIRQLLVCVGPTQICTTTEPQECVPLTNEDPTNADPQSVSPPVVRCNGLFEGDGYCGCNLRGLSGIANVYESLSESCASHFGSISFQNRPLLKSQEVERDHYVDLILDKEIPELFVDLRCHVSDTRAFFITVLQKNERESFYRMPTFVSGPVPTSGGKSSGDRDLVHNVPIPIILVTEIAQYGFFIDNAAMCSFQRHFASTIATRITNIERNLYDELIDKLFGRSGDPMFQCCNADCPMKPSRGTRCIKGGCNPALSCDILTTTGGFMFNYANSFTQHLDCGPSRQAAHETTIASLFTPLSRRLAYHAIRRLYDDVTFNYNLTIDSRHISRCELMQEATLRYYDEQYTSVATTNKTGEQQWQNVLNSYHCARECRYVSNSNALYATYSRQGALGPLSCNDGLWRTDDGISGNPVWTYATDVYIAQSVTFDKERYYVAPENGACRFNDPTYTTFDGLETITIPITFETDTETLYAHYGNGCENSPSEELRVCAFARSGSSLRVWQRALSNLQQEVANDPSLMRCMRLSLVRLTVLGETPYPLYVENTTIDEEYAACYAKFTSELCTCGSPCFLGLFSSDCEPLMCRAMSRFHAPMNQVGRRRLSESSVTYRTLPHLTNPRRMFPIPRFLADEVHRMTRVSNAASSAPTQRSNHSSRRRLSSTSPPPPSLSIAPPLPVIGPTQTPRLAHRGGLRLKVSEDDICTHGENCIRRHYNNENTTERYDFYWASTRTRCLQKCEEEGRFCEYTVFFDNTTECIVYTNETAFTFTDVSIDGELFYDPTDTSYSSRELWVMSIDLSNFDMPGLCSSVGCCCDVSSDPACDTSPMKRLACIRYGCFSHFESTTRLSSTSHAHYAIGGIAAYTGSFAEMATYASTIEQYRDDHLYAEDYAACRFAGGLYAYNEYDVENYLECYKLARDGHHHVLEFNRHTSACKLFYGRLQRVSGTYYHEYVYGVIVSDKHQCHVVLPLESSCAREIPIVPLNATQLASLPELDEQFAGYESLRSNLTTFSSFPNPISRIMAISTRVAHTLLTRVRHGYVGPTVHRIVNSLSWLQAGMTPTVRQLPQLYVDAGVTTGPCTLVPTNDLLFLVKSATQSRSSPPSLNSSFQRSCTLVYANANGGFRQTIVPAPAYVQSSQRVFDINGDTPLDYYNANFAASQPVSRTTAYMRQITNDYHCYPACDTYLDVEYNVTDTLMLAGRVDMLMWMFWRKTLFDAEVEPYTIFHLNNCDGYPVFYCNDARNAMLGRQYLSRPQDTRRSFSSLLLHTNAADVVQTMQFQSFTQSAAAVTLSGIVNAFTLPYDGRVDAVRRATRFLERANDYHENIPNILIATSGVVIQRALDVEASDTNVASRPLGMINRMGTLTTGNRNNARSVLLRPLLESGLRAQTLRVERALSLVVTRMLERSKYWKVVPGITSPLRVYAAYSTVSEISSLVATYQGWDDMDDDERVDTVIRTGVAFLAVAQLVTQLHMGVAGIIGITLALAATFGGPVGISIAVASIAIAVVVNFFMDQWSQRPPRPPPQTAYGYISGRVSTFCLECGRCAASSTITSSGSGVDAPVQVKHIFAIKPEDCTAILGVRRDPYEQLRYMWNATTNDRHCVRISQHFIDGIDTPLTYATADVMEACHEARSAWMQNNRWDLSRLNYVTCVAEDNWLKLCVNRGVCTRNSTCVGCANGCCYCDRHLTEGACHHDVCVWAAPQAPL